MFIDIHLKIYYSIIKVRLRYCPRLLTVKKVKQKKVNMTNCTVHSIHKIKPNYSLNSEFSIRAE